MITNATYKNYCDQIAKLFCSEETNKVLCEVSTSERLKQKLDDEIFQNYFLPYLPNARFYELTVSNIEVIVQAPKYKIKFKVTLLDIVTGQIEAHTWETAWYKTKNTDVIDVIKNKGYQLLTKNKTLLDPKVIVYNTNVAPYGITFVPSQVPGYNPPSGGGGNYNPPSGGGGNFVPTQTGGNELGVINSNIGEIFSNPIVLIGIGVAAFFLLKDKF